MRFTKFILAFLMISSSLVYYPLPAQNIPKHAVARAAIDFGSGALKIQVSIVDPESNCIIGDPLIAKYVGLDLTEDVAAHDGWISEAKQQQSLEALERFKEETLAAVAQYGNLPLEFSGVATAVFRKAYNGLELLQKFEQQLGIRFQILTQEDEGIVGFRTGKAIFSEIPDNNLLVWDSGNGSFQFTAKDETFYNVYQGPLGHGTARILLSKDIRNGPALQPYESVNPISSVEAEKLENHICALLPSIPDWLQDKLADDNGVVVTFGDAESIFAVVAKALALAKGDNRVHHDHAVIKFVEVQSVIDAYLDQTDEMFDSREIHRKTLTSAILLSTIMKHFKVQSIHYHKAIGNTAGMLISPQLWQD